MSAPDGHDRDVAPSRGRLGQGVGERGARLLFSPTRPGDVVGWVAFAAAWAAAACLTIFLSAPVPLRAIVTIAFAIAAPGLALVRLLRLTEPVLRLVLTLAVSIAVDLLVSLVIIYAGAWSPRIAFVGIASATTATTTVELVVVALRGRPLRERGPAAETAVRASPAPLRTTSERAGEDSPAARGEVA